MNNVHDLSAGQKKAIRLMAGQASGHTKASIMEDCGMAEGEYINWLRFLDDAGLVHVMSGDGTNYGEWFALKGNLAELVYLLDNPPPKDHWSGVVRWFRGKRWSVPLVCVFVLLPLLFQWAEMIKKLLGSLGIVE